MMPIAPTSRSAMPRKQRWLATSPVTKATHTSDHLEQLTECHIAELMALAAIEDGTATPDDVHRLHCLALIALALNPARSRMASAMTTLMTNAPDVDLVRELVRLHSVDRYAVTAKVYQRAVERGLTLA